MGVFRKNKQWWIDFYHEGKRVRRKVGPSKRTAETVLADVQVKQAKQEFLGICDPRRIKFGDFAKEYLEYSRANKARTSYERDMWTIKPQLIPRWGNLWLGHITLKTIEDYRVERLGKVVSSTLNRELNTIKHLFRKAVEWGYLKENPARTLKWHRTPRGSLRFLSHEEADKLLESCLSPFCGNRQLYPIVVVALHTGMRRGEITRLYWEDLDFKRKRIMVVSRQEHHTKNYETRVIPMNDFLFGVLQEQRSYREIKPYVFCLPDGKPFDSVDTSFPNAVVRAGIPHVRFHDLRHTFASWLVMGGVDIRTIQELLGHKDLRMTMRYSHLAPDHLRYAVTVLQEGGTRSSHQLDTRVPEEKLRT